MTEALAARTTRLLDRARYLTLATVSPDGSPWAAVLQYAWLPSPLRFVFGSATESRHSRNIAANPTVSGSLFTADTADFTAVDGAQFTGRCAEIGLDALDDYHGPFYEHVFPDTQQRTEWSLPPSSLLGAAPHRLYLIEVDRWWLVDTSTWAEDRIDRRVEVSTT
ncbi:pyridoxamine 5'-phosphate oxidase family protein [Amycolatopsis sp. H6(2020)]|nr:pyridoxamine 5'-phosphate oxidase family protein [Amycolatopsis sp. H6(2020)]